VNENDVIEFVTGLPGVVAFTAAEDNGAPQAAWGDTFFHYDPDDDPANRKMPFATIVVKDYEGFDTASDLNRPGVFRVNIAVGRAVFEELLGYPPAAHADHHEALDYRVPDRILPHPLYAAQSWICVLNPGEVTAARVRDLLTGAHARAAARHRTGARSTRA
jgi:predicted DNA-binding protein (MmcQ/YjbR family)